MEHMDAAVPIFQRRVGPLGLDVPPAGEAEFDHLVEEYRAQLGAGQGPVHINCMIGMAECRAAMLAVEEADAQPLLAELRTLDLPCGDIGTILPRLDAEIIVEP